MIKAGYAGTQEATEAESSDRSCDVIAKAMGHGGQCRVVDRRGKARLRKPLNTVAAISSYLEFMSISKQAQGQYLLALDLLSDLSKGSPLDPSEADQMLVRFFNRSFLQGLKQWDGEEALVSLLLFATQLAANGSDGMPRCWCRLKGWRKLRPVR